MFYLLDSIDLEFLKNILERDKLNWSLRNSIMYIIINKNRINNLELEVGYTGLVHRFNMVTHL